MAAKAAEVAFARSHVSVYRTICPLFFIYFVLLLFFGFVLFFSFAKTCIVCTNKNRHIEEAVLPNTNNLCFGEKIYSVN